MNIIIFITIIFLLSLIFYFIGLSILHDFSLPSLDLKKYYKKDRKVKILSIFPHPDDETVNIGGLLQQLSKNPNVEIQAITTTAGERGDELFKLSPEELGDVRRKEFREALQCLGVEKVDVWDFPDGGMGEYSQELKKKLEDYIKRESIDIIITYERTGLYGHGDHIVLSLIVRAIQKETGITVLYSTLPQRFRARLNLPKKIQYGDEVIELDQLVADEPEYKLSIWRSIPAKYRAMKAYKSQNLGQGKPLWLIAAMGVCEYYSTTWDQKENEEIGKYVNV